MCKPYSHKLEIILTNQTLASLKMHIFSYNLFRFLRKRIHLNRLELGKHMTIISDFVAFK